MVRYERADGGKGLAKADGFTSVSLGSYGLAHPYRSRSYRAEHTVYLDACDCFTTFVTSPK